ncbi:spore coat protein CotJB [Paenibacillus sp. J31TS4]|uniref:spore coat protein CotJB n=1 Tax=Paenibacillus sp. J31TS4 TaxID=2807195 RepID=UPI001B276021|nr:spore coat protein CotJB [Paenibacillus sp. J31TS4]GIP39272.1 spore coat protein CotJB [Paenibacillus sp. J31TS4]
MEEQYYAMLHELQAVDFVLVELNLYLDTHPWDTMALQQFNEMAQKRQFLAAQFEQCYGPLLNFGHSASPHGWRWAMPPWPWQV